MAYPKSYKESTFEYFYKPDQKCGDKYCENCNKGIIYSMGKMDKLQDKMTRLEILNS